MPSSFCMESPGPKKLRVETIAGLVFGTSSEGTPELEAYLGAGLPFGNSGAH